MYTYMYTFVCVCLVCARTHAGEYCVCAGGGDAAMLSFSLCRILDLSRWIPPSLPLSLSLSLSLRT